MPVVCLKSARLWAACLLSALALPVLALPYNGAGPGESTIGVGGDYPSLAAACAAIGTAPLTGGDWTFLILNDLTEPQNSSIVQADTGGHTITFRPAPGVQAVITFSNSNPQPSLRTIGHITVGADRKLVDGAVHLIHTPTHNIVIDGSNAPGGTTRHLKLKNTAGPGARTLIGVMGDCHNITVKNCHLESYGAYAESGALAVAGVEYAPNRQAGLSGPAHVPQNGLVQNCKIQNFANTPTAAVAVNRPISNFTTADQFTFPDNTITSSTTGLEIYCVKNLAVQRNDFQIDCSPAASNVNLLNAGIMAHPVAKGARMVISRNRVSLANAGKVAKADGIVTRELLTECETLLENNIVTGDFTRTSTSPSGTDYHGIRSEAKSGSTVTLHHNSIAMHGTPVVFNSSAGFLLAPIDAGSSQYGRAILRNNIIRAGMKECVAVQTNGNSSSIDSDFNDLFAVSGAIVGRLGYPPVVGPDPGDLATWQTRSGQDLNSSNLDPYVPAVAGLGTWVGPAGAADADLHFSAYPGPNYRAPALATVTEDFDGNARPGPLVVMGADEMPHASTRVDEWALH